MNREIKFRAWDNKNKCFVPSSYWNIDPSGQLRWNNDDEAANIIPMQFTGLYDKNGKGIYEGDIVTFFIGSKTHENSRFEIKEVFWYDDEAGFFVGSKSKMVRPTEISSLIDKLEVIGNIYENPELLEND